MNTPKVNRTNPETRNNIFTSLYGRIKASLSICCFIGGILDLTVRQVTTSNLRIRKAAMRIAHPKPTRVMSRSTMMGKITPPALDPEAMIPYAAPRFLLNQLGMELIDGWKIAHSPIAPQTPCDSRTW